MVAKKGETLPVNESFFTWQGEGVYAGRACFFFRLHGCPLACPWCDSAGTWHPDWIPDKTVRDMHVHVDAMVAQVRESGAKFIVITGGEPAIHDLSYLVDAMQAYGIRCHIETSGTYPFTDRMDWITVSPKRDAYRLNREATMLANLQRASEWKLIVDSVGSIEWWLSRIGHIHQGQPIYLHPEWSQRQNLDILMEITNTIKDSPKVDFRAGYQLHKLYGKLDQLDPGADQRRIPLGGNLEMGY